jgi:hypothetical protein
MNFEGIHTSVVLISLFCCSTPPFTRQVFFMDHRRHRLVIHFALHPGDDIDIGKGAGPGVLWFEGVFQNRV